MVWLRGPAGLTTPASFYVLRLLLGLTEAVCPFPCHARALTNAWLSRLQTKH